MNKTIVPQGYAPKLNSYETQLAIDLIKHDFQKELSRVLTLKRVSAPLFVRCHAGLNDNLTGKERPVEFDIPAIGCDAEIVHSLAKWKRVALKQYGFSLNEGLLTDMNAIRRDEELDNLHSIYVDQWDWEKIITEEDRNPEYLKAPVRAIVDAIVTVGERLAEKFPVLSPSLCREVTFVTAQELEDLYPDLSPADRESAFAREHKTVFIMQIGGKMRSGISHGNRAPDYDDWTLNGDIIFWNELLGCAFEISSMGIRVDPATLEKQLAAAGCEDRRTLPFHRQLLGGELPLTMGGGIGQSRLCMLLMGCAHIGEVQSSLWDEETQIACHRGNIPLL